MFDIPVSLGMLSSFILMVSFYFLKYFSFLFFTFFVNFGKYEWKVVSAIVGGYNDIEFNFLGYSWMFLNCVSTAAYVLYLRKYSIFLLHSFNHSLVDKSSHYNFFFLELLRLLVLQILIQFILTIYFPYRSFFFYHY